MTTYFKKNDKDEYVDADNDVEELFKQRSGEIVSSKLAKAKEKLRTEIEDEVRKSALETIKGEARKELEDEYKAKLEASESKVREYGIQLRRKTIAAEYGFKPEAEQFLGDGDENDMRAKADALKTSFSQEGKSDGLEKSTEPKVSELQQKTGITVEI